MAQTTTKLTHTTIQKANGAVDTYVSAVNGLNQQLDALMKTLQGVDNFSGDASDGYQFFYEKTATPALTTNLTAPQGSLCASLKEMFTSIEQQLLNVVDPKMGEVNRDPSSAAQDTAAPQT